VSWLVEAGGVRVLHLGDTMFHGAWWRIARRLGPFDLAFVPVNGAVVSFPHRQPASPFPVAMAPEQAAVAAQVLGARTTMAIHAEGYDVDGVYAPVASAGEEFLEAAAARGVRAQLPTLGLPFDLPAAGG
jgi:L-ascorbate metabolism protein UlaG (beta-lactamase superfamily)